MNKKKAIVLAAGKGTRMKSDMPKVCCSVLFKPMINYVLDALKASDINDICVVTGYKGDEVKKLISENIATACQEQQLGTGHAVLSAHEFLDSCNEDDDIVILNGDAPFMDEETINKGYELHKKENNAVTVISAKINNPFGYGRIVKDKEGKLEKIVEQKDASEEELLIDEINSGAYWFNIKALKEALKSLKNNNSQGEYYLTDTVDIIKKSGLKAGAYCTENSDAVLGANSKKDLLLLNKILNKKIIEKHMENGVEFVTLDGIVICSDVKIGSGTTILPGTVLKGNTIIGKNSVIGPNSLVENSIIGDNTKFNASQCYQSEIKDNVTIGPFCHIRPNSKIKNGVHLGDFVEIKNSVLDEDTHVSHLTYVGDSDVGKRVNFGCGVVTVNYNGKSKARCVIEDDAFIGCNTNLVAPVKVGKSGYTAAGSTITKDVPAESLAIARARQENKEGYNKKLRGK